MNIFRAILDFLGGSKSEPPTLRNRPGGMAMIQGFDSHGFDVLNGRIVTTVRLNGDGFWDIDPPQDLIVTADVTLHPARVFIPAGNICRGTGLPDHNLRPLPGLPLSEAEVRELYAPHEPRKAVETA
jgi:hypothetical protein